MRTGFVSFITITACVALLGCSGDTGDDGNTKGDDPEQTADTGEPAETGGDTGTATVDCETAYYGSGERCAELVRVGVATVTPAGKGETRTDLTGTEELRLVDEFGSGETICSVTYDLVVDTVRDDCPKSCAWSFDLEIANPKVGVDEGGSCSALFAALDIDSEADLAGEIVTRGYDPDFEGHAQVLMVFDPDDAAWNAVTFLTFNETSGQVAYEWFDGVYPY